MEYRSLLTKNYLAGYFDGDGSVFIVKNHGYNTLALCVVSSDIKILKVFKKLYGGAIYKRKVEPQQKQTFQWKLERSYTIVFLKDIYPYAIIKKTRIKAAIRWYETTDQKLKNSLYIFIRRKNKRAVNPEKKLVNNNAQNVVENTTK